MYIKELCEYSAHTPLFQGGSAMLSTLMSLMKFSAPHTLPAEEIPWAELIAYCVAIVLLLVLMLIFRKRFLKILCVCGAEIFLFFVCKLIFGPDALITQIMCWVTAAVACIVTVSTVNRIDWGSLQGRPNDRA